MDHMFFSLKLLCKKSTYNINHCGSTIKKNSFFFSCWALYHKCVEPSVAFILLLLFNVFYLNKGVKNIFLCNNGQQTFHGTFEDLLSK
jgi:hypothetical protein